MSTRCQVQVIQEGMEDWKDEVTLYHHSDGYPENIIPLINKALQGHIKRHDAQMVEWNMVKKEEQGKPRWQAGRAGKVASMLCWADPEQFEPEQGHKLHGDIEYYYKLYVVNHGGGIADSPSWEVEVFTVHFDDKPPVPKLPRQPLAGLMVLFPNNYPNHEVE